ncbi:MAG: nucleoside-diphosphate sugar epimerase/dehydratase, partial [Planctomycetota bacterium]
MSLAYRIWNLLLRYRVLVVAALHLVLSAVAYYAAFAFRLDTPAPWGDDKYGRFFFVALPVLLVIRFSIFLAFDLFKGMWRYVSISDLMNIFRAVTLGTILFVPLVIFWLAEGKDYSGSVFVLDWVFCVLLLGGIRFGIRAFREAFAPMRTGGKRVIIVGAGDAGEMLLREMKTHQHLTYLPVGFVDDDKRKKGMKIHGVKVLGGV